MYVNGIYTLGVSVIGCSYLYSWFICMETVYWLFKYRKNNKNVCLMEIILTLVLYHVIQHSKVHLLPT